MTSDLSNLIVTVQRPPRFGSAAHQWAAVSSAGLKTLARSGLSSLELAVFMQALGAMEPYQSGEVANEVDLDMEAIARERDIRLETVKRAAAKLVKCRLLLNADKGYEVNPLFAFSGSADEQQKAVDRVVARNGGPVDVILPNA
ncbi:hypothetical protein [Kitasatospora aburaviensis]|uniref:Plasmid replication protein RepL domain-containing protein n=1 Tax=Kitasatospora aburaviensis TaxID=67265 RepID=A0ABW1EZ11_9ACTN